MIIVSDEVLQHCGIIGFIHRDQLILVLESALDVKNASGAKIFTGDIRKELAATFAGFLIKLHVRSYVAEILRCIMVCDVVADAADSRRTCVARERIPFLVPTPIDRPLGRVPLRNVIISS